MGHLGRVLSEEQEIQTNRAYPFLTRPHTLREKNPILAMNPSTETPEQQKSAAGTSRVIAGKDERLEVLSESPLVLETPLSLLAGSTITPKSQLFVRNARDLPQAL
ncbi:MAG TPA: hypothetical protein VIX19_15705, partial [Terriglobales bacterium]